MRRACLPGWMAPVVVLLTLSASASAQIVRSGDGPPKSRDGMIAGQVVDATTGAPVSDAILMLTMPKDFGNPAAPAPRLIADSDGRFFFSGLPAGDYHLEAAMAGYAAGEYGQRRAGGQSQILSLAPDERRTDIVLRLWKYAAIGGTVVDEAGEPVVGVAVRALVKDVIAGRVQFGNAEFVPELVPSAITDDRGIFRLSQLLPGTYVVVVPSTQTTLPVGFVGAEDAALRSDLYFSGVNEVTLLGHQRTQQFGDSALLTPNSVAIPPFAGGRLAVYRTTFYPSATTAAAATPIVVRSGEERTELAIALRPEPSVRVSGRLVTPDGSIPPPTTIRLIGEAMKDVITAQVPTGPDDVGFQAASGISDSTGRFTLLGVPAGEYILNQGSRFPARTVQQGKAAYSISQPLTVGTEDISDLVVPLRPVVRVEGRFELNGTRGAKPPSIAGVMFETPYGERGQFAVQATRTPAPTFSSVAAGGRYIIRAYGSSDWVVQSVTIAGTDVTDRAFDLQSDATSIVITLTDQPTKVSGVVRDARGAPSPTAVVLAFPVDRARWSGYGMSPRDLESALTTSAGLFTFDHLPPGGYYLIAIDPSDADEWMDPARLDVFAGQATRLTIAAGESSKTVDLVMRVVR